MQTITIEDWPEHREAIGIDLGGTQIKAVLIERAGMVQRRELRPTAPNGDFRETAETIRALADELGPDLPVAISAPGLVRDDRRAIALMPGRLQGLENFDWTDFLKRKQPVHVTNDAHAALLGEAWLGAARRFRNAIMLTLGTGVGGAILLDGKLYTGRLGRAGHFGHACVDQHSGMTSITGMPGALECYFGNYNIGERTGGRFATTHALLDAVRAGDAEAAHFWQASIHALACALGSFINIFDPDAVIIGGGIAQAGDTLFKPLKEELDKVEWRPFQRRVVVIPAELGEWAGAIGVAHETWQKTRLLVAELPRAITQLYQARKNAEWPLHLVKEIIARETSFDEPDKYGKTVFEVAVECGMEDVAEMLENAGASTKGRADAMLLRAIQSDDTALAKKALEMGADTNSRRQIWDSVILIAVDGGHAAVTRILLEHGAILPHDAIFWLYDEYFWDRVGGVEALAAYERTLQVLLEFGADPNAVDEKGRTAAECLGEYMNVAAILERVRTKTRNE